MDKRDISRLQAGLNSAGYNAGLLDGVLGPKTLGAAATYLYEEFDDTGCAQDALEWIKTKEPGETIPGIDVSAWNGKVNWEAVAAAGYKYAIIKQTEGTTHTNKRHRENLKNAKSNGLLVGGYHFARPNTYTSLKLEDARNEAYNFLKAVGDDADLVPSLDLETGLLRHGDHSYNIEWCLEWAHTVEKELGLDEQSVLMYTARWVYSSRIYRASEALKAELAKYPLWWCEYRNKNVTAPTKKTTPWGAGDYVMWQWTSKGKIPGCKGNFDLNRMKPEALGRLKVNA